MSYKGPKAKISRRLGIAISPKAQKYVERRPTPPGMHGKSRRPKKKSDYGRQLTEKQRLRFQYNLRERQLRNYYIKATRKTGNPADILLQSLECRLDALTLRAGFARSIHAARQLVGHGHINVNGRKVDVPSYACREGDVISVREKSRKIDAISFAMQSATFPPYLNVDIEDMSAKLIAVPKPEEIPVICEISLVVEFYSR